MKSVSLASPLAPLRSAFRPTRTPSSPRAAVSSQAHHWTHKISPYRSLAPKVNSWAFTANASTIQLGGVLSGLWSAENGHFVSSVVIPHTHKRKHKSMCMKCWMSFSFPGPTLNRFVFVLSLRGPLDSIFMDVHFSSTTKSRFWWGRHSWRIAI